MIMQGNEAAAMLRKADALSYADMIDALERGTVSLEYSTEEGVICRHSDGLWYIACLEGGADFLSAIPRKGFSCVHGEGTARLMIDELGYCRAEGTWLYSYHGRKPRIDDVTIIPLGMDKLSFVVSRYSVSSEEDIASAIDNGHLFGAYSDKGALMGFAGFHSEDSMGMLTVLPEYRRMGIGAALERHLIRTALEEDRLPYCNVFMSNSISIRLQGSLGLERGEIPSYWIWTD